MHINLVRQGYMIYKEIFVSLSEEGLGGRVVQVVTTVITSQSTLRL